MFRIMVENCIIYLCLKPTCSWLLVAEKVSLLIHCLDKDGGYPYLSLCVFLAMCISWCCFFFVVFFHWVKSLLEWILLDEMTKPFKFELRKIEKIFRKMMKIFFCIDFHQDSRICRQATATLAAFKHIIMETNAQVRHMNLWSNNFCRGCLTPNNQSFSVSQRRLQYSDISI